MKKDIVLVSGTVIEGYRVASRPSQEYPYSTLERQMPFFKVGGLNLERFFTGTLNVSISPIRFEIIKPAYTFRQIAWTNLHPPEDFSFSQCCVRFQFKEYEGYVYFPHPETKIRHFQDSSLIEVISEWIPGVRYGTRLELILDPTEIRIY